MPAGLPINFAPQIHFQIENSYLFVLILFFKLKKSLSKINNENGR